MDTKKQREEKPLRDILIFMSDQHTPYYSGFYGDRCVDTPNLNRLCDQGVAFDQGYTVSPLCGPARMSFLCGKRPASTGIFHRSILPDTTPTFLHYLVEQGYETVLVGRMHFIGPDQYHGFTRHIAADMTPVTWNYQYSRESLQKERGVYAKTDTFSGRGAASLAGGGTSPVLEYDRFVVDTALEYMRQPHRRPQCICVSIYGPHFPYVAPKELYLKYRERVTLPATFNRDVDCELLRHYQAAADDQMALACQAAYCGMVEHMDSLFGQVWTAFDRFCESRKSASAVFYLSDHGDQCGDRHIFGKETFYERSVKIPWIAAGDGIKGGRRVETPVSIMDIGPTILEYIGAKAMDDVDGISAAGALLGGEVPAHLVYSEFMERTDGKFVFGPYDPRATFSHGFMLRYKDYKYVTYQNYEKYDMLFNISDDPEEEHNLAGSEPEILEEMRRLSRPVLLHEQAVRNFRREDRVNDLMSQYEWARGDADLHFRWNKASEAAGKYPEICVKNPAYAGYMEDEQ